MNPLIRRLAGMFGQQPFTTAQARCELANTGLEAPMPAGTLGAQLREAVGRPITEGARTFVLTHAGTAHNRTRRWAFQAVVDRDMDIL